jgi:hypothetical protein
MSSVVDAKPDYFYIRYVTLGEAYKELKVIVGLWVFFSALSLAFGLAGNAAEGYVKEKGLLAFVPIPVWIWIAIAVLSWIYRGVTVHIPRLSFREWMIFVVVVGVVILLYSVLPWWEMLPFYWGLVMFGVAFDALVGIGKTNYEKRPESLTVTTAE